MQISFATLVAVGLGGLFGAIARLYVNFYSGMFFSHSPLPFGTIIVNIGGSFIIGLLFAIFSLYTVDPHIKSFLVTGFLGALTTFSTFAMETIFLLNTSLFYALINITLNLFGSIIAAGFGFRVLSYFLK